jgi:hypothetical protein
VEEISIDYSQCDRLAGDDFVDMPSDRVHKYFKTPDNTSAYVPTPARWKRETNQSVKYPNGHVVSDTNICTLQFSIDNDLKPPVLFYYRLTNFYQNHRRYVKSFDADQLKGVARSADQIGSSDCDPIRIDNATKLPIYPCGLIANSIFNDTFQEPVKQNPGSNQNTTYNMLNTGISWSSDKDLYKKTAYKGSQIVPPPNWVRTWPNYTTFEPPNLSLDEGFQVWMRTAGLPAFSKLARRNDKDVMARGTYELVIWDGMFTLCLGGARINPQFTEFNVTLYGGTKSVLISTRTVMGGKNPFLGIAYIVVGGLCILLGALFTATHIIKPR